MSFKQNTKKKEYKKNLLQTNKQTFQKLPTLKKTTKIQRIQEKNVELKY